MQIAALVAPGHADNSISIALGYGRKMTGPVGEESGFNGYLLRTSSNPHYITADDKTVKSVSVKKVAGTFALAVTQEHWSIEGRALVREATLEHYRKDEDFVQRFMDDEELAAASADPLHPSADDRAAAVGDDGGSECLHRLQRVRHCLPERK